LHIGSTYVQATAPTVQVADTVGAGDVFWASCLADWLQHDTLKNDALAMQKIENTLQRALRAAAINCERVGCQPPGVNEIEEKNNAQ
jgi:fructokinase